MTRAEDVDAHFVAQKRAARCSWAAIARMSGCSELSLRRRFDVGDALVEAVTRPAPPASPRERVRQGLIRARFSPDDASILARMWMAGGARRTAVDLAAGIGGGAGATEACRVARKFAEGRGVSFAQGYALTEDGLRRVAAIAGLRSADDGAA